MHAAAVFRLHLTRPAQHRVATATLHDNATMIFPARAVSRASVFDSSWRDRRLQTAVYCRCHKDFVAETIRAHVGTRCIRDASKTSEHENVNVVASAVLSGLALQRNSVCAED